MSSCQSQLHQLKDFIESNKTNYDSITSLVDALINQNKVTEDQLFLSQNRVNYLEKQLLKKEQDSNDSVVDAEFSNELTDLYEKAVTDAKCKTKSIGEHKVERSPTRDIEMDAFTMQYEQNKIICSLELEIQILRNENDKLQSLFSVNAKKETSDDEFAINGTFGDDLINYGNQTQLKEHDNADYAQKEMYCDTTDFAQSYDDFHPKNARTKSVLSTLSEADFKLSSLVFIRSLGIDVG